MDVDAAIMARKSVRAFRNNPVQEDLLWSVLGLGLRAPSWGNTQPWEVFVVTDQKLDELKKNFREKFERDELPNPDFPIPTEWPDECLKRHKDLGKSLFEKVGIGREDRDLRRKHYLQMCQGFGAPVFIYICLDKKLSRWSMLDVGIFIQTVCLAAVSKGLGSCILTHLVLYPDVIRKELQIPESKYIVMGIALGYAEDSALINRFQSPRENKSEVVKWFK